MSAQAPEFRPSSTDCMTSIIEITGAVTALEMQAEEKEDDEWSLEREYDEDRRVVGERTPEGTHDRHPSEAGAAAASAG